MILYQTDDGGFQVGVHFDWKRYVVGLTYSESQTDEVNFRLGVLHLLCFSLSLSHFTLLDDQGPAPEDGTAERQGEVD